jgi:phosphoglycolate phosphatase-like HAD superfamily hydrolase
MVRVIGVDVDGALFDSVEENYERMQESWLEFAGQIYPLSPEQFRSIRHLVTPIMDYFSVTKSVMKGGSIPKDIDNIRKEFRISEEGARAHEIFYKNRKKARESNLKKWLESQKPYDGVAEMLEGLKQREVSVYVVTAKDEKSVVELFDNYGLMKYIKGIFDNSINGGRKPQFEKLREKAGIPFEEMCSYDDMAENLIIARGMGIYPIAARQGYDRPENLVGFTKAYPREVPLVIDRLNSQS